MAPDFCNHRFCKPKVGGSIPSSGTIFNWFSSRSRLAYPRDAFALTRRLLDRSSAVGWHSLSSRSRSLRRRSNEPTLSWCIQSMCRDGRWVKQPRVRRFRNRFATSAFNRDQRRVFPMINRKITTILAAAALVVATSVLAPRAEAHRRGHYGGAIAAGVIGGLLFGALAHAGHRHYHRRHYYYYDRPYYGPRYYYGSYGPRYYYKRRHYRHHHYRGHRHYRAHRHYGHRHYRGHRHYHRHRHHRR